MIFDHLILCIVLNIGQFSSFLLILTYSIVNFSLSSEQRRTPACNNATKYLSIHVCIIKEIMSSNKEYSDESDLKYMLCCSPDECQISKFDD